MTADRELQVTEAFVSLASNLANGYDVVEMLTDLTEDCVQLLDVASAGLLLADGFGRLHVLAASSEATRELEVFQLQRDEGPCRDCYHSGSAVSVPDLAAEADRWPQFVPRALQVGFRSVHAVPMRLRDNMLGALNLFGTTVGELLREDLVLAQALADVASVALVQERAVSDRAAVVEQLQLALNSRVVLEQAKGVLAYVGELDMGQAFNVLRRYARDHNLRLTAVAESVVSRAMSAHLLLDHARPKDSKDA
jgi:GAF domain-containing protein